MYQITHGRQLGLAETHEIDKITTQMKSHIFLIPTKLGL